MQNKWVNFHHLRYFMTIAQTGTVAKAAQSLRLGQSTLSTQLAQFEDQLGLKLFERRQKRLHLTEMGRIALRYAEEIFKLGGEMIDALHDRRHTHRLSVQVGMMEAVPLPLAMRLIEAARSFQECTISIVHGHALELVRALKAHELDIALLSHQPPAAESLGLKSRLVGSAPVAVYAAARFASLAAGFPGSLDRQPWLWPGIESRLRAELEQYCKRQNLEIDVVVETPDLACKASLAAAGVGILAAGEWAEGELLDRYGLAKLGRFGEMRDELWLLTGDRRLDNPLAAQLQRSFRLND